MDKQFSEKLSSMLDTIYDNNFTMEMMLLNVNKEEDATDKILKFNTEKEDWNEKNDKFLCFVYDNLPLRLEIMNGNKETTIKDVIEQNTDLLNERIKNIDITKSLLFANSKEYLKTGNLYNYNTKIANISKPVHIYIN